MSTLISQLLDDWVLRGILPSDELLREHGTDIKVLAQLYEQYKPSMDWFIGYEHVTAHLYRSYSDVDNRAWSEYRQELHGVLARQTHTIRLLHLGIDGHLPSDKRGRGVSILLLLSRRGDWIVWASTPEFHHKVFKSLESAVAFIEAKLPAENPSVGFVHRVQPDYGGGYYSSPYNTQTKVPSVALAAARSLHSVFEASSEDKRQRVGAEQATQAKGALILDRTIEPQRPVH